MDGERYLRVGRDGRMANPNAPNGLRAAARGIEVITASNPEPGGAIDEAYVDFGGQSAVPADKEYGTCSCTQTYSKARSMAGARLGYA